MNVNSNNIEEDKSDEDKNDESKTVKKFDAILKDINNIGRTTKPISFKIHGSNINLHSLIIRLLSAGETVLKKDYRFDEVFYNFDETGINHHELNEYNLRTVNKISIKNEILQYLKIMEWNLIDMLSTLTVVRKINSDNFKGYK